MVGGEGRIGETLKRCFSAGSACTSSWDKCIQLMTACRCTALFDTRDHVDACSFVGVVVMTTVLISSSRSTSSSPSGH